MSHTSITSAVSSLHDSGQCSTVSLSCLSVELQCFLLGMTPGHGFSLGAGWCLFSILKSKQCSTVSLSSLSVELQCYLQGTMHRSGFSPGAEPCLLCISKSKQCGTIWIFNIESWRHYLPGMTLPTLCSPSVYQGRHLEAVLVLVHSGDGE